MKNFHRCCVARNYEMIINGDEEKKGSTTRLTMKCCRVAANILKTKIFHNSPAFPIAALTSDHEPFVIEESFRCTKDIYLALEGSREVQTFCSDRWSDHCCGNNHVENWKIKNKKCMKK